MGVSDVTLDSVIEQLGWKLQSVWRELYETE